MAGPRIPEWQNVQGIQEGGMSAAYDKAGALFTTAIQAGQNILDDKVKRESAEAMEGILGSDNREELGEAQEAARSNVWADQTRVTEAGLGQKEKFDTKDIVDEERVYTRDRNTTQDTLAQQKADDTAAYQKESNRIAAERNKEDAKIRWAELNARNAERKAAAQREARASASELKLQDELGMSNAKLSLGTNGLLNSSLSSGTVNGWVVSASNQLNETGGTVGAPQYSAELEAGVRASAGVSYYDHLNRQIAVTAQAKGGPLNQYEIKAIEEDLQGTYAVAVESAVVRSKAISVEGKEETNTQISKFVSGLDKSEVKHFNDFSNTARSLINDGGMYYVKDVLTAGTDSDSANRTAASAYMAVAGELTKELQRTNPAGAAALEKTVIAQMSGGNIEDYKDASKALSKVQQSLASILLEAASAKVNDQVAAEFPNTSIKAPTAAARTKQLMQIESDKLAAKMGTTTEALGIDVNFQIPDPEAPMKKTDTAYQATTSIGGGFDDMGYNIQRAPSLDAIRNRNRIKGLNDDGTEKAKKVEKPLGPEVQAAKDAVEALKNGTPAEKLKAPMELFTEVEFEALSAKEKSAIKNAQSVWEIQKSWQKYKK